MESKFSNILSRQLIETRLDHEKYQMNLPFWYKFVIWSYTLGSGTVNGKLLGRQDYKYDLPYWLNRLVNTFKQSSSEKHQLPEKYKQFEKYFFSSTSISSLSSQSMEVILDYYIEDLQKVILASPALKGDIVVFKASSSYPGLTVKNKVKQPAFNSTSYRVDMNYSIFLPAAGSCCMHKLTLKKGSRALILSPLLSAYPDESEIILPFGVSFDIQDTTMVTLKVPITSNTFKTIQKEPYAMGPVYFYNYNADCNTKQRVVKMYISVVEN